MFVSWQLAIDKGKINYHHCDIFICQRNLLWAAFFTLDETRPRLKAHYTSTFCAPLRSKRKRREKNMAIWRGICFAVCWGMTELVNGLGHKWTRFVPGWMSEQNDAIALRVLEMCWMPGILLLLLLYVFLMWKYDLIFYIYLFAFVAYNLQFIEPDATTKIFSIHVCEFVLWFPLELCAYIEHKSGDLCASCKNNTQKHTHTYVYASSGFVFIFVCVSLKIHYIIYWHGIEVLYGKNSHCATGCQMYFILQPSVEILYYICVCLYFECARMSLERVVKVNAVILELHAPLRLRLSAAMDISKHPQSGLIKWLCNWHNF